MGTWEVITGIYRVLFQNLLWFMGFSFFVMVIIYILLGRVSIVLVDLGNYSYISRKNWSLDNLQMAISFEDREIYMEN